MVALTAITATATVVGTRLFPGKENSAGQTEVLLILAISVFSAGLHSTVALRELGREAYT